MRINSCTIYVHNIIIIPNYAFACIRVPCVLRVYKCMSVRCIIWIINLYYVQVCCRQVRGWTLCAICRSCAYRVLQYQPQHICRSTLMRRKLHNSIYFHINTSSVIARACSPFRRRQPPTTFLLIHCRQERWYCTDADNDNNDNDDDDLCCGRSYIMCKLHACKRARAGT